MFFKYVTILLRASPINLCQVILSVMSKQIKERGILQLLVMRNILILQHKP